ncbi:MAG: hypothetical protein HRU76_13735 [Phycisphaeraceae bacterium]|nr:MAG: hypothetical protein HRU76_13735 [Phycisphaeraceae bacterium]
MTVAATPTPVKRFSRSARHLMRCLIAIEEAAIRVGNIDEQGRPIVTPRQATIGARIGVSARQVRNIRAECIAAGWLAVQKTGRALRWFILVARSFFTRDRFRSVSARAPRRIESARASDSREHRETKPNGPERPMGSCRLSVTKTDLSDPRRLREIAETASRDIGRHGRLVAPGRDGLRKILEMAAHALHTRGIRDAVRAFCAMLWHPEKRRTITLADEDRATAMMAAMDRERYPREAPEPATPQPKTPEESDASIVRKAVQRATSRPRQPVDARTALRSFREALTQHHGWTPDRWKRAIEAAGFGSLVTDTGGPEHGDRTREVPTPLPPPAAHAEASHKARSPAPAGAVCPR